MKNIQIIDGANNCAYEIYSLTDKEFSFIFPNLGQDVEFIEDVIERLGNKKLGIMMSNVWKRRVKKPEVNGIHGTLFYELSWKRKYYPTKKSDEMATSFSS